VHILVTRLELTWRKPARMYLVGSNGYIRQDPTVITTCTLHAHHMHTIRIISLYASPHSTHLVPLVISTPLCFHFPQNKSASPLNGLIVSPMARKKVPPPLW
jgi:hypothetical protein